MNEQSDPPIAPAPPSPPTPSFTPPTRPGTLGDWRPEPVWPRVIGIIAIIFGSFGILGGCGTIAQSIGQGFMSNVTVSSPDAEETQAMFDALNDWMPWNMASGAFQIVLAVLLLIAGIGLVTRRRWARLLCLLWSGGKLFLATAVAVITYLLQQDMMRVMEQEMQQTGGGPALGFIFNGLPVVAAVFTFIWYSILPVFLIIWFTRPSIREQCERW